MGVYGHPLYLTIKETIYRSHNNGKKSPTYYKSWNEMLLMGSCFITSFIPVIFGNTLVPAWSPRLYLINEYKKELKFLYLIQKISVRKDESANSFPSGHISETSVFIYAYTMLGMYNLRSFFFFINFNIAWATMILRCHYIADVFISYFLGFMAFYISYYFGYYWEMEEEKYNNIKNGNDFNNGHFKLKEESNKIEMNNNINDGNDVNENGNNDNEINNNEEIKVNVLKDENQE